MSEFELHQLLAHNRELISDTWYYFLTVHLAVFGIVHVANRRVRFPERLLLYAAYFGFLAVNYFAQSDNYGAYLKLAEQLAALPGATESLAPKGAAIWVTQDQNLLYLYAGAAALSVLVILFTSHGRRDE
ncbi:MAG: hypothetical protein R3C51_11255 [Parvularculaceae bacterium]